ncbi:ribonuclease III [Arvimicrobium flavum]|uniref:ribonuclease III n=1 Tax=Arvimicrobium flavum TaxID=3393320 RepID=UPI00237ADDBF|nr:ribonuclease III [Mesorhizobium shangrilense]
MPLKRPKGDALAAIIAERTGYAFHDVALLQRALTHSSVRGKVGADNERLEFLGDRVLALVVAEMLFRRHPEATQGELAVRLSSLVSGDSCAEVAEEIGMTEFIHADAAVRGVNGRKAKNVRADAMEALIAAVYLDSGLEPARAFILRFWEKRAQTVGRAVRDPKTMLQEWLAQKDSARPTYAIIGREGPDHEPVFTVEVQAPGFDASVATGRSRQAAEQAAAAAFLAREGVTDNADAAA